MLTERIHNLWNIIVDPRPQSLSRIAKNTNNTWQASIGWLIIVSFLFSIALAIFANDNAFIGRVIIGTLMFTIGILFWVFCIHYLCMVLFHKRTNYYEALLYIVVSIYTVAITFSIILYILPFGNGMLDLVAFIYFLVLVTIAIRAITNLAWWKTLITMTISTSLAIGCIATSPLLIINLMRAVYSTG